MNRDLVEFYVRYKLCQRGGAEGEELGFVRLGEEGGGGEEGERGEEEDRRTNSTENRTDAASADCHSNGVSDSPSSVPGPAPSVGPGPAPSSRVKEALRDSAVEFELRFSRAFSDLHRQLHLTPSTAYTSFASVMDEVFRDGVNWGRVVGLFAFGGALCVECVDKDMSHLVQRIVGWMTVYLDEHIQDWIDQQGGWVSQGGGTLKSPKNSKIYRIHNPRRRREEKGEQRKDKRGVEQREWRREEVQEEKIEEERRREEERQGERREEEEQGRGARKRSEEEEQGRGARSEEEQRPRLLLLAASPPAGCVSSCWLRLLLLASSPPAGFVSSCWLRLLLLAASPPTVCISCFWLSL
uniref:Bcl-2 Bcl-2 homology region 1-3 domain-containing protein n=1 Tax=Knipowitschia caucasica TaxID=637954 RepID=A0AAV2M1N4_KNICA